MGCHKYLYYYYYWKLFPTFNSACADPDVFILCCLIALNHVLYHGVHDVLSALWNIDNTCQLLYHGVHDVLSALWNINTSTSESLDHVNSCTMGSCQLLYHRIHDVLSALWNINSLRGSTRLAVTSSGSCCHVVHVYFTCVSLLLNEEKTHIHFGIVS